MELILGIVVFAGLVLILSAVVLIAKAWLIGSRPITVSVNDKTEFEALSGRVLLTTLAENDIHLSSACGGAGTCGLCRATVTEGGRDPIPVETAKISRADLNKGVRLACQVKLRTDTTVSVPDEVFGVGTWTCRVRSNDNVTSLVKELILDMPDGEIMDFRAGGFVEITCPPYQLDFGAFDIAPQYQEAWQSMGLRGLKAEASIPTTRAYSLANHTGERDALILNIRIALPPPGAGDDIPPGVVSSYLFGLKSGDSVSVSGPFGHFFPSDSDAEMVYIGGGAGMAPMRAHILDLLVKRHSKRKISFWYGARSQREIFYVRDFEALAGEHDNFDWTVGLSDPITEDDWSGETGFIHEVVQRAYLANHPAPETCEYYLCGPPMMIKAVTRMLDSLGVDEDMIFYDDFGG